MSFTLANGYQSQLPVSLEPLKTVKLLTLVQPPLSLPFNYTALIRKATLEGNTILAPCADEASKSHATRLAVALAPASSGCFLGPIPVTTKRFLNTGSVSPISAPNASIEGIVVSFDVIVTPAKLPCVCCDDASGEATLVCTGQQTSGQLVVVRHVKLEEPDRLIVCASAFTAEASLAPSSFEAVTSSMAVLPAVLRP